MSYIYLILINRKLNWISYVELLTILFREMMSKYQDDNSQLVRRRSYESEMGHLNTPSMNIINKLITQR